MLTHGWITEQDNWAQDQKQNQNSTFTHFYK